MRTFRIAAAVTGLALLLSACGLLNSFIPDQQVSNPLGLNGKSVTLGYLSSAGLGTQAVATTTTFTGSIPVAATFPDFDASNIPAGVHPNGFAADIDLGATATVSTGTPGSLPTTFDLTDVSLTLTVADGSGSPSLTKTLTAGSGSLLIFTQTGCTSSACDYSVQPGPDLGSALLDLQLSSSDVATLWQIITGGDTTNDVTGNATVTVDHALPTDSSLNVTLVSPTGTLTF